VVLRVTPHRGTITRSRARVPIRRIPLILVAHGAIGLGLVLIFGLGILYIYIVIVIAAISTVDIIRLAASAKWVAV
jgi:hypothetical protein